MKRVLIASASNWTGIARLPSTLGPAGFDIHLIDRGRTQAASSRWVSQHETHGGPIEDLATRVCERAAAYDRVIACDEPLLLALATSGDLRADAFLPAPPRVLLDLLDKTRFPSAASAAGIRVARSRVAPTMSAVSEAVDAIGGKVVVKGRHGLAGQVVRDAADETQAVAAATRLGLPVLVEERLEGECCLMPCLFERGTLVGALSASRVRTVRANGPSTVNLVRPVSPELRSMAQTAGTAFGLHGFVSIDYFEPAGDRHPVVIEINLRPVPQLHLGARVGVDMAALLSSVLSGGFDGPPQLPRSESLVTLFPQELHRLRTRHGALKGTMRWLRSEAAFADVPWDDMPLTWRHLRRMN